MSAKIIIGGDIVPTPTNMAQFIAGDRDKLIGKQLGELVSCADFTICNLETPLTDETHLIVKKGPHLGVPTSTVTGLLKINNDFYTLANNHILDQGEQGLLSTIKELDRNSIAHAGAGHNLEKAAQGYIKEICGVRFGIYCCAEHEFSIASEKSAGANPFDPLESYDHVEHLSQRCDHVIVLYHGGKEYYRYPSPMLQKVCRKFIHKGATLVVCQHSHCIGCKEDFEKGTIIYGQGDFIFRKADNEFRNSGLLLECSFDKDSYDINYIPFEKSELGVEMSEEKSANRILGGFYQRSEEIKDSDFVKNRYVEFCKQNGLAVIRRLTDIPNTLIFRIFNKLSKGKLEKWFCYEIYVKRKGVTILNIVECESWRELLLESLRETLC